MSDTKDCIEVFSFGGGVQSNAALVLAANGKIKFDYFVFSNVGDDSEEPETLEYIKNISNPYAIAHGIPLVYLDNNYHVRPTVYRNIMDANLTIPVPAYLNGGAPVHRVCTVDYKIRTVERWVRSMGYNKMVTGLGISTDEITRASTSQWEKGEIVKLRKRVYPLIDLHISRNDCIEIIRGARLPVPPKSSCWFCPYKTVQDWKNMMQNDPERFNKAIEIEDTLNERGKRIHERTGKQYSFTICRNKRPLRELAQQIPLFEFDDNCESGYCMV